MIHKLSETIVAPITGPGPAAVALVRISGPSAHEHAIELCPRLEGKPARTLVFATHPNGDEGYAVLFHAEKSFTGEPSAEFHLHGSRASVSSFLDLCIKRGIRAAEPGEFTLRAFLNGRIDLVQAEAVRELVDSASESQFKRAQWMSDGHLSNQIRSLSATVTSALVAVEASVDFSEEIGPFPGDDWIPRLKTTAQQAQELAHEARRGAKTTQGILVALVGAPNAGKSSLLNRLIGRNRAIVSPTPGTTRDAIEVEICIGGHRVTLIDTAGLRETQDPIEREGIQRTQQAIASADLTLHLFDSHTEPTPFPVVGHLIATKSDLGPMDFPFQISSHTGAGIAELEDLVAEKAQEIATVQGGNSRHAELLAIVKDHLDRAISTLEQGMPDDLLAVDLRAAVHSLGEITGETATEDLLDQIFREFCIGK